MDNEITVMRAVGRLHAEWRRHMRRRALSVGIPDSYRPVIMFLKRNPGSNQRMLAEFSGTTCAAVNQIVKKMEADGYVEKRESDSDGRMSLLFLTEKGMNRADALLEALSISDKKITESIGVKREEELIGLIRELTLVVGDLE